VVTARCPVCGRAEGRVRCCWPLPTSPLSFFGPETWLDDDELDRVAVAGRLGASEFTAIEFAAAVEVSRPTVSNWATSGRVFPTRYEEMAPGVSHAVYGAEKVAGVLLSRGMVSA
jgi:hypothetical protein